MYLKGLAAYLAADSGVSGLAGKRVFPGKAPKNAAAPYVTYRQVSRTSYRSLRGSSNLDRARVQIDGYAATEALADQLGQALRDAIGPNGFVGTWDTNAVQLAKWDDGGEDYIEPWDNDTGLHQVSLDLIVIFVPY